MPVSTKNHECPCAPAVAAIEPLADAVLIEPSESTIAESNFVTGTWLRSPGRSKLVVRINGRAVRLDTDSSGNVRPVLLDE